LNVIPEKPHDAARELGMKPTGIKLGFARLIFHTGHGVVPDPPVYRFPLPSPVSPSIDRGVVMTVVKVEFSGNWEGSAHAKTWVKQSTKAQNIATELFPLMLSPPKNSFA
jgi:hypothetical protein